MSMLAEPKRKVKYGADPRGETWARDDNKFGQKLMEKMGWSKGKGLGANEDGSTDHVKVSLKSDTRGVGCTKKFDDNWIAHQDDFNDLLASLNENKEAKDEVMNLEMRSKNAKGKIHYMKFAKGKDLSSRNAEDLDCIFGRRKSAKNTPIQSEDNSAANSDQDEEKEKVENNFGVVTISTGTSVQDYFKNKMELLMKKRAEGNNNIQLKEDILINQGGSCISEETNPKKRKLDDDSEDQNLNNSKRKSKKNRTSDTNKDADSSEENASNNCEDKSVKVSKKKKSKKNVSYDIANDSVNMEDGEDVKKVSNKKKKNKHKDSTNDTDTTCESKIDVSENGNLVSMEENKDEEVAKKKKKEKSEYSTNETNSKCESSNKSDNTNTVSDSSKKKKCKKSKQDNIEIGSDNKLNNDGITGTQNLHVDASGSRKKKKKSKKNAMNEPNISCSFKGSNIDTVVGYMNGQKLKEKSIKKKKRSKRNKIR